MYTWDPTTPIQSPEHAAVPAAMFPKSFPEPRDALSSGRVLPYCRAAARLMGVRWGTSVVSSITYSLGLWRAWGLREVERSSHWMNMTDSRHEDAYDVCAHDQQRPSMERIVARPCTWGLCYPRHVYSTGSLVRPPPNQISDLVTCLWSFCFVPRIRFPSTTSFTRPALAFV